jgi:2-polyprenyl-6-methoxyphenol hydroxylase-like FAD-dependent oxidoreductase
VLLLVTQSRTARSEVGAQAAGETIVVMGGGIAGLGIALALRGTNHRVVIVERDEPPPEIEARDAFERWKRPGVFQFRHPHVFLGRIQRLLRERYPDVFAELCAAGFWPLPVSEYGIFRDGYTAEREDDDLIQLCGRRATFEYVLQRCVRALPHVTMVHGAQVIGLQLNREGRALRITGIQIEQGGRSETITGDMFIDCMGRRSPVFEWLRALGPGARERTRAAQTLSFSRHYRLREGHDPQLYEQSGDLDFLRYAIVYGEDRHFAIGFSIAESDTELIQTMKRAHGFERVCAAIPQVSDWVAHADPLTPVMGAGDIRNRWIHWADRGKPKVLGLLHAGDSARETNPFYGRGCSAAFVEAHLVADALLASSDPAVRARHFALAVRAELQPYYELAISTDRLFEARSNAARGQSISLYDRLVAGAYLKLAVPAAFEDHQVARKLLGVQHMRRPLTVLAGAKLVSRMCVLALRRLLGRSKPISWSLPPPRASLLAPPSE